jgi:hypothetical protein
MYNPVFSYGQKWFTANGTLRYTSSAFIFLLTVHHSDVITKLPHFSIDNVCVIYTKRSKFVKSEYARYKLEYFSIGNARVFYTKGLNS